MLVDHLVKFSLVVVGSQVALWSPLLDKLSLQYTAVWTIALALTICSSYNNHTYHHHYPPCAQTNNTIAVTILEFPNYM